MGDRRTLSYFPMLRILILASSGMALSSSDDSCSPNQNN